MSAPMTVPPRNMQEQKFANASERAGRCLDYATGAPEPKLEKHWLRMARSFKMDAELLVTSRSMIDESRRLLASLASDRTILSNVDARLLASSRAMIDESRRLLAGPERPASTTEAEKIALPTVSIEPTATEALEVAKCNSAMLSVRVRREGSRFDWTVFSRTSEMLGRGTAETEFKARIDAFAAGMTYIERLKRHSKPTDTSLH